MKQHAFGTFVFVLLNLVIGDADSWLINIANEKILGSRRRSFVCHRYRRVDRTLRPYFQSSVYATLNGNPSTQSIHSNHESGIQPILDFLSYVQASLELDHFLGLTMQGPSQSDFDMPSEARGYVRMIKCRIVILNSKAMIQATFKYHGATDICKNWNLIDCRNNLESILIHSSSSNIVPDSEWGRSPLTNFGFPRGIKTALLQSTNGTTWELKIIKGKTILKQSKIQLKTKTVEQQQKQEHDRNKYTYLDLSNPVWKALGVVSSTTGTVKPGMSSKLRQCQKFVEIVDRLVEEYMERSNERQKSEVSIVDMGCGRAYLTFALHSFLYNRYQTKLSSRGIDVRPKLVAEISKIASSSGMEFERLKFNTGTIENFLAESPASELRDGFFIEVVVALHACDTATDDALWSGVRRNSDIIIVAPCCHQQLRHQLDQHTRGVVKMEHPYMDVLRHNIYRERIAETVTDSLRALLLELSGYTTQVFEFIGGEHTSKNVMITAVKNRRSALPIMVTHDSIHYEKLKRIQSLAMLHGIRQHKLASWMGVALEETDDTASLNGFVAPLKMPPLNPKT
jgi:hypothetical protein